MITVSCVRMTYWRIVSGNAVVVMGCHAGCTTTVSSLIMASASIRVLSPAWGNQQTSLGARMLDGRAHAACRSSSPGRFRLKRLATLLITVARSRCSTGAPIVAVDPGARSSSLSCG